MPHTSRTFHDRGIADTIWKRARWARQERIGQPKGEVSQPSMTSKGLLHRAGTVAQIPAYVTEAVVNFLKGK